ncbi:hypothetical protein EV2_027769 [Malus domestica]
METETLPERESSWETKSTSLDFMKLRGLGLVPTGAPSGTLLSTTSRPPRSQVSNAALMKKAIMVERETVTRKARSHRFCAATHPTECLAISRVYDGMTQLGYEKSHCEFSFGTEQRHVTLSMAAILLPFPLWCKDLILRSYQKMAWMLSYQGREQLGAPLQLCHPHPQSQLLHGDVKGHVILHMKLNITTQLRVMSPSSFCLPKCANIGRRKSGEITTRWLHLECILSDSLHHRHCFVVEGLYVRNL